MVLPIFLSVVGVFTHAAIAQQFEPKDFDVVEGLAKLGINVTEIPALDGFGKREENRACAAACSTLSLLYGEDSVYTEESSQYDTFTSGYWSLLQADVNPYCIFKPATALDVSAVVLLSRFTQCPFAVKSGGHAAFTGASNIEGGITVSMEKMKKVSLSCDNRRVLIQPGNVWADVYEKLDKKDITVTGGRVAHVGTGGLTLGGGISFFSNIYGWACDNVIAYEVVTAAGYIVTAAPDTNPDLYWALRGGGNNFGIVTGFVMEAIPLPGGKMWGGTRTYLESDFDKVADAFAGIVANSPSDPNAGLWVAYLQNSGLKLAATELWYAKPNGSGAAIFDDFNALTAIADTTQERVLHDYTVELEVSNPAGLREVYYGLTVKANPQMARIAREIFYEELPATTNVKGANPVMIFQGIMEGQIKHMSKNGGNPLGINAADGPLYLIHIASWWEDAADDETIYAFISKVLNRITAEAKKLGVENDYIYMNYASLYEDVIANYGPENKARLKKIAAKYDPTQVFQKLQPGHFKLDRAPVVDERYFSGLRA